MELQNIKNKNTKSIKQVTFHDCESIQQVQNRIIESSDLQTGDSVLFIKITLTESVGQFEPIVVNNQLQHKCDGKAVLVYLVSTNKKEISIIWKTKDAVDFSVLEHFPELPKEFCQKLYEFTAECIVKSLGEVKAGKLL